MDSRRATPAHADDGATPRHGTYNDARRNKTPSEMDRHLAAVRMLCRIVRSFFAGRNSWRGRNAARRTGPKRPQPSANAAWRERATVRVPTSLSRIDYIVGGETLKSHVRSMSWPAPEKVFWEFHPGQAQDMFDKMQDWVGAHPPERQSPCITIRRAMPKRPWLQPTCC